MKKLGLLLELKATAVKNTFQRLRLRSRVEFFTLIFFFGLLGAGLFFFFFFSFRFFSRQEPFGPILLDETFYLFTFALFVMLLISSAVSAYTSLFRSGEVTFLLTRPLGWDEIYFFKLNEALWYSSWALLFIAVPFMTAYGMVKHAGPFFPAICFVFTMPFIVLAGSLGTLIMLALLYLLPDRKRQRLALFAVVVFLAWFFFRIRPEVIKEQGSLAGVLSGYLPHVTFAKNPLFPSSWTTRGIIFFSQSQAPGDTFFQEGKFYFLLLLSNALFFLIPSYSAGARLYPKIYYRIQDLAGSEKIRRARAPRFFEKIADAMPWPPKAVTAFLEKDLKTFFRDPSEWSQMIIFFGLLLLYFSNLKNMEFHVLKSFWKNIVFVLNSVGTYIVLSSFSMRFIFPMLSLEGARFWIIDLSPIRISQLLLEKFLLGTLISAFFTVPLLFLSGWMLEIPLDRILYTTGLGFFVCVALTGLSVGFGAKFPNFKSTNPSEIISGFGGSVLLVSHLAYLALVGTFLMLSREAHAVVFLTAAAGSLLIGTLPLYWGMASLKKMEF
ncbi:MAG TPA: hypothetical protein VL688_01455 [Verrucomicrobiae bacterium]|jgi:ABC-2 type transport system permease protein|nr:hypothetical protein [Verrucomicrobiae bacterium]